MKAKMVAGIAVVIGLAFGAHAQNMIEYSTAATHSAGSVSAAGSALNKATKRISGSTGSSSNSPKLWEAKPTTADKKPAKPTPPAVFILANGERFESSSYLLTADSLSAQQGTTQRNIPLSQLNLPATLAANHQRGIDLQVPKNSSQIMLSF